MAIKIKPLSQAKDNYRSSTTTVQKKYEAGVKDADWLTNASSPEAEELYQQKLAEAFQNETRRKAIAKLSNEDWKQRALTKGASQIASAMNQSVDKWGKNTQPYLDVIANLSLEPRTNDPEQNVIRRVVPIAVALNQEKKRRQSS